MLGLIFSHHNAGDLGFQEDGLNSYLPPTGPQSKPPPYSLLGPARSSRSIVLREGPQFTLKVRIRVGAIVRPSRSTLRRSRMGRFPDYPAPLRCGGASRNGVDATLLAKTILAALIRGREVLTVYGGDSRGRGGKLFPPPSRKHVRDELQVPRPREAGAAYHEFI
jgi:hypothetical protein